MHPPRLQLGAVSIVLAAALLTGNAHAEPGAGTRAPFQQRAAGSARFEGWTPLSSYVSAGLAEGGSFQLTVPTRRGEVEIALRPVEVHAARYHAEEVKRGGERRGRRRPQVQTFAGTIEAGGSAASTGRGGDFARLAQGPDGRVSGLLRVDGVLYDLAADPAAGDLVLALREIDPVELAELLSSCGSAIDETLAGQAPLDAGGAVAEPESAAALVLREVELGTEADAPFVAQVGGVAAANAKILSMVNAINGIYESDLGLTHKVVFQRAWNGSDPYTSNDSGTLLSQFRSNFLAGVATTTDDALLFSGRDFENSVVGRAYVSAACTNSRFGINQFYQQSESLTRLIAAHEMGHNFGGAHTSDGIMAPSINPSVTWFGATSQSQIGSYVNSLSCLAEVSAGAGPPVLAPIGPQTAAENSTLSLQLEATDPDGGALSWSALPLPVGASLSSSGLFQWRPALDTVGCNSFLDFPVTFYATDPDGNQASESVMISVLDTPTGAAPDFADPADRAVLTGQALSIPLSASDDDGDSVSFAATSLPAGATLSPSGAFSWTPSATQLGVQPLGFTATDCTGESSAQSVAIDVVSSAPLLRGLSAASGQKGDEITLDGQNFAGRKVRVYFGTKKRKPRLVTDTSLVVRVPKLGRGATATSISVLRDGVASQNTLPFTFLPPEP